MFRSTGLYLQILFFLKEINNRASLLQYRDELTRERERERERERGSYRFARPLYACVTC
jgi:hypothetical protein